MVVERFCQEKKIGALKKTVYIYNSKLFIQFGEGMSRSYILFGFLICSSLYSITEKDLPKFPAPIRLNIKIPKNEQKPSTNQEDVILDSIKGEVLEDLNLIPWNDSQEKPLAPGLKRHKKKPQPKNYDQEIKPSPILLRGLILIGEASLADIEDLECFSGFKTVGLNPKLEVESLNRKLKPLYFNKEFNEETVDNLVKFIQQFYQDRMIGIVSVSVPKQDISSQVLCLVIKLAKIDQLNIIGNRYLSDLYILDEIPIAQGSKVKLKKIEKYQEFFNLNPMQKALVTYNPKNKEGAVDAIIHVGDRFPLRPYAGIDNQGLELIGPIRSFYGANYANLFDINDLLSFQYTATLDFNKYQAYSLDYKGYVSPWLMLELFGGYVLEHISYQKQKKNGHSYQGSIRLDFPFILHPNGNLFFGVGADFKGTNNNFESIEYDTRVTSIVNLTQAIAKIEGNIHNESLKARLSVEGILSIPNAFANSSQADYQNLRIGAKEYYAYLKGTLDLALYYAKTGYARLKVKGQLASNNLLPSEEFFIGGFQQGRGYIENAAVGDLGYFGSFEFALPAFKIVGTKVDRMGNRFKDGLTIAGFLDAGKVYAKRFYLIDALYQPKEAYLLSVGPKLAYKMGDYLEAEVNFGYKLKHTVRDFTSPCRINFKAMMKF
jgi:hemolysin activation/secretion protein